MKIALVQPSLWHRINPPLGLASLSSFLASRGHETRAFDFNCAFYNAVEPRDTVFWSNEYASLWQDREFVEKFCGKYSPFIEDYLSRVIATGATVVGFSVQFSSILATLELAQRIKRRRAAITVVAGGPACRRECGGDSLAGSDGIDYVIAGEGELPLSRLVACLERNETNPAIPGLLIKQDGRIVEHGEAEEIAEMDVLPYADFSSFSMEGYQQPEVLPFSFSRGCINRCIFCCVRSMHRTFRSFSARRVIKEIIYQKGRHPGFNSIVFCDSITNGDMEELSLFCDMMIDEKKRRPAMRDMVWQAMHCAVRIGLTGELAGRMYRAGCRRLGFGVESGSEKVLRDMKKPYTPRDAALVLKQVHDAGIRTMAGFIVGFPSESDGDFDDTLAFVRDNAGHIDAFSVSEMCFTIEKGAAIYEQAAAFSVLPDPHFLFWSTSDGNDFLRRLQRLDEFKNTVRQAKGNDCPLCYGGEKMQYKVLSDYHRYKKEEKEAQYYYRKYSDTDGC